MFDMPIVPDVLVFLVAAGGALWAFIVCIQGPSGRSGRTGRAYSGAATPEGTADELARRMEKSRHFTLKMKYMKNYRTRHNDIDSFYYRSHGPACKISISHRPTGASYSYVVTKGKRTQRAWQRRIKMRVWHVYRKVKAKISKHYQKKSKHRTNKAAVKSVFAK